ncbi:MAG: COR domain-containing protein [Gallionella sp.]|nr:COR domain-containing protein [Gallionella sp.]
MAIKQALEQKGENYISYEAYRALCTANGITEPDSQKTLCGLLHDLGIVLNFQDDERFDRLRETNVLNPEWVTNAVYKLLNIRKLFQNHGVLNRTDLAGILDKKLYPTVNDHQFIIDMMRKFEMCFSITDKQNQYLIPELLLDNEPYLNWDKEDSLRFEYHYDILPHSVFSRFIVRLHDYIFQQTYWRTGVVLAHEGNKALIKADLIDRKIFVWVTGTKTTRRSLLAIIRKEFKHIHQTIKGLEVKECVPLTEKVVITYAELLNLENKKIETHYYAAIDAEINVAEWLSGIESEEARDIANRSTTTIHAETVVLTHGGNAEMSSHKIEKVEKGAIAQIGTGDHSPQTATNNPPPKEESFWKNKIFLALIVVAAIMGYLIFNVTKLCDNKILSDKSCRILYQDIIHKTMPIANQDNAK